MIKWTKRLLVLTLVLGLFTCLKPIQIDLPSLDEGITISAYLSTKKGFQEVRIQRLAPFTNNGLNYPIKQAEVWITDNLGQRQDFREDPIKEGIYLPRNADYVGEPGKTYVLHITTSDQREIESSPQTLRAVPPIKKVYSEEIIVENSRLGKVVNGFNVMLDVDDPPSEGDYYRWNWLHYEQLDFCAQFDDFPAGGVTQYKTLVGLRCCQPCWGIVPCFSNCANVLSDALSNGKTISRHRISRIPYCPKDYYIEIQQRSISREAYDYWRTIDQLTTNNGSLFDTAPAAVRGNLKCVSDPAQAVYGLFEVSDFEEDGFFIIRTNTSKPGLYTCEPKPLPAVSSACVTCEESAYRTQIKPRFWNR
ncbi:DUF4249 domain-containing protein [Haliscomenobacter hydrossis]|uniref:DUF4249 domain-containing protein n=1 Tax=Haliscomenobacter hydrossis (strain ATCC 27775 / DSM 1100 / LMG 10767 / O) TaxID=760192 RepID=F4KY62_HALH1|nr:DUF4249 domain-containing protein [Haliscomenobacter hydrossis]AEE48325.1 hypothetical protein Halhy_0414 [Haliscomenobacter hydrossis DSM 1100]